LELSLLDLDVGRFRYHRCLNVTIGVWVGQATLDSVQRVQRMSQHMIDAYPGGHSSVVFVLDGAPAPTPEAQAGFATIMDPRRSSLSCIAVLVEGQGFWASGIRSSITQARLASAGALKLRVHDTIAELLEWFPDEHHARTGVRFQRHQLRHALETARALGASADDVPNLSMPPAG
jgi:hypothetical protein